MLICVAELLEPSDFDDIEMRYPKMGKYFSGRLPEALARRNDPFSYETVTVEQDDSLNQACIDALHFALVRANGRNPEKFAQLTSRVFGKGACPIGYQENNLFYKESLSKLLTWKPDSWWIPQDEDLTRMEALLSQPGNGGTPHSIQYDLNHGVMKNSRCYFSAAAIAIDYCK
jgi:hypothetical protein